MRSYEDAKFTLTHPSPVKGEGFKTFPPLAGGT